MKKYLFFIFMVLFSNQSILGQDFNDELGRLSDVKFNHSEQAVYLNDEFVKSQIGCDLDNYGVTYISKQECETPLVINGVTYKRTLKITCSKPPTTLIGLQDVRKKYCPQTKGKVIFMINKFFITHDEESYKLDENYISHCEVLSSKDFAAQKSLGDFTIIRVFMKTKANTYPMRIR